MASTLSNFFYKMLNRSILQYIITILQSKSILQFAEKSGTECESGIKHTNAPWLCVLNNLDNQLNMSYTNTYSFISEWSTHGLFLNTVYTCAHRTPLLLYNTIDSVWKKQYTIKTFFLDIIWHGAVTHILTAFKNSTGNVTSQF